MKLDHTLFAYRMTDYEWDQLEDHFMNSVHDGASAEFMEERRYNLQKWRTERGQEFVLTKTAVEICSRIKIDIDNFDYTMLKNVVRPMATIHWSRGLSKGTHCAFMRYFTKNNKINCLFMAELTGFNAEDPELADLLPGYPQDYLRGNRLIFYCSFGLYINTGQIVVEKESQKQLFIEFMQLMSYIELSDTEHIVLKPKKKYRGPNKTRFINLTNNDFYLVDASWNTYIHVGEFNVRGHFRWQPCGRDHQSVKLVFINEFKKSGYHRRPKKEII